MAYGNQIQASVFGRRLGLQQQSSAQSGGTRTPKPEWLIGPDALRDAVTTSESTGTQLYPHGVSYLANTSAASSNVWKLDPPVPGVMKTLVFSATGGTLYVGLNALTSSDGTVTVITGTQGTTKTVISSSVNFAGTVQLMGVTTAIWTCLTNHTSGEIYFSTTT